MIDFKTTRLGDLISIKGGYSYKGKHIGEGSSLLLGMGCVSFKDKFLHSGARLYSGDCPETHLVYPGDLVLATRQQSDNLPILGLPAIIPKEFHGERVIVGTNLYKVINHSDVSNEFLFWLLKSSDYRNHILSNSKGSTVRMITKDAVESYEFDLPSKVYRESISETLWNIENKIDLLHRQNKTLEQMAETLFRQWFVEETKEDWKEGKLGYEFDFTMGQSPPGSSYNEEGIGIPMYQGNRDFGFRFPSNRVFTTESKRLANKYDTLISVRAPVGEQNMASEICCIGRGVAAFRYKTNSDLYTYTYFKLKSLMREIKEFNHEGTVFGSISKSDFENIDILIPPIEEVTRFQEKAKPMDDKIIVNVNQVITLENLRDTLLPKLMSGEVTISDE